jgi:hypothetical protein
VTLEEAKQTVIRLMRARDPGREPDPELVLFTAEIVFELAKPRTVSDPPPIAVVQTKEKKDRKDTAKYWCTIHGPSDLPCFVCGMGKLKR